MLKAKGQGLRMILLPRLVSVSRRLMNKVLRPMSAFTINPEK